MFHFFIKTWLRICSRIYIKKYKPVIIGITGNTGKTSTKEAIYRILKYNKNIFVRKTPKNLNTDIGVPLAILGLEDARRNIYKWLKNVLKSLKVLIYEKRSPDYLVLELAADCPGEIEYFTKFINFDVGIVTTIGDNPVHLEFFSSKKELINEKSFLISGVKKEKGIVILNKDDKDVERMKELVPKKARALFYGSLQEADLKIVNPRIVLKGQGKIRLKARFNYKGKDFDGCFTEISHSSTYSFAAALLATDLLGFPIEKSIKLLEKDNFLSPGRMNLINGKNETLIIDDSYNASPLSYINALEALDEIGQLLNKRRKVIIAGDMAELGKESSKIHQEIIEKALEIGDIILCVGDKFGKALKETKEKIKIKKEYYFNKNTEEAIATIEKIIKPRDIILIKGAQVMRTEKIVKAFMKNPQQAGKLIVRQESYWLKNK